MKRPHSTAPEVQAGDFTVHALARCVERHGFMPDPGETMRCVAAIRAGLLPMLRRVPDGAVFSVELGGNRVEVVYLWKAAAVVTVLPRRESFAKLLHARLASRRRRYGAPSGWDDPTPDCD